MKKGDIVLVKFPFTDRNGEKLRPALVLISDNEFGDVSLAFISSQVESGSENDVIIEKGGKLFEGSGLKTSSVIRLNKIVTLSESLVKGKIGELNKKALDEVNKNLKEWLKL